jgi:hypothetical protein
MTRPQSSWLCLQLVPTTPESPLGTNIMITNNELDAIFDSRVSSPVDFVLLKHIYQLLVYPQWCLEDSLTIHQVIQEIGDM